MANARLVLRKTKTLLKTGGWTKNQSKDEQGRHCLTGALFEVNTPAQGDALLLLNRALAMKKPELDLPLDDWLFSKTNYLQNYNDNSGTQFEDILNLIDEAIALD